MIRAGVGAEMMYPIYTAVAAAAVMVGYAPRALGRRLVHGVPVNLGPRLGYGRRRVRGARAGWIHAVSVGEAIAAAPVVTGLRARHPGLPLVMTTTTETGAQIVRDRYAGAVEHRYFPLDLPGAVRRAVDAIDPAFALLMETELWPNVLRRLAIDGIPVMMANGRISDRSFPRYHAARRWLRPVLGCVTVFAMQSEEDARRIRALGASADRVFVTGNVKLEAPPDAGTARESWARLLALAVDDRVWVAGSTHAGEEEAVLAAHAEAARRCPRLTLVLAPRHPERVPEVVAIVAARGWPVIRRSELPGERPPRSVVVLDTLGELASLYTVADVVFVGGSLVASGGHNLLEPALRDKPVLFGPHTENFREAAAVLLGSGGGRRVDDSAALGREVVGLLEKPDLARQLGRVARDAVVTRHGAVERTLDLVDRFLVSSSR